MGVSAAAPSARHAFDAVQAAFKSRALHVVASALELGNQRLVARARLDLRRAIAAAEVRQIYGSLDVELPVEHADERLRYVVDDGGAAERADDELQAPLAVEHHRRRHARAWALAAGHRVRRAGREIEIGELVVEEEAAHHDAAAEDGLDGGRHRHRVAIAAHDREMAGAALVVARDCLAYGLLADQRCAFLQVLRTQETSDRDGYEIRIAEVACAIGVGEPPRFSKKVHGAGGLRRRGRKRGALQYAEYLQHADAAG